jgi:hypothetical protein
MPHIQKVLGQTYHMTDHEIADLEIIIKKQCDIIISRQKDKESELTRRPTS